MTTHTLKIYCNNNNKLLITLSRNSLLARARMWENEDGEIDRIKSQFSISREYFELLIYETTLLILYLGVLWHILYLRPGAVNALAYVPGMHVTTWLKRSLFLSCFHPLDYGESSTGPKLENFLCTPIFNQPALFSGNYFLSLSFAYYLRLPRVSLSLSLSPPFLLLVTCVVI